MNAIVTVIGSLIDKKPSDEVIAIFDEAVKD